MSRSSCGPVRTVGDDTINLMEPTMTPHDRWDRRKRKHHNDHNHSRRGWVCGNPRYQRTKPDLLKNRTMGCN